MESPPPIFCSTIIPTIGRDTLSRAVQSVLAQETDDFSSEIIVVNDSGKDLPEMPWMTDPRVQVLHTMRRERSVARNTGAACARGAYFHFLDDDDWLLPGAMIAFKQLAEQAPKATWLYGATQLVDRDNTPLIQLKHGLQGNCFTQIMAGEWIPLQSSLIPVDAFFELRGFLPGLSSTQDVDLCRKAALLGDFAETDAVVACVGMGEKNSTTDRTKHLGFARWARDQILNSPGVFSRMQASASTGALAGRMVRIFLTSAMWNLQHRKPLTALSRGGYGMASLVFGLPYFFSPQFWGAIRKPYASPTFAKGFETQKTTD